MFKKALINLSLAFMLVPSVISVTGTLASAAPADPVVQTPAGAPDTATGAGFTRQAQGQQDQSGKKHTIQIPANDKAAVAELYSVFKTGGAKDKQLILEMNTNSPVKGEDLTVIDIATDGSTITFNNENFQNATERSRKDAMGAFIEGMQNSPVSQQTQQNVVDTMSTIDDDVSRMLIPLVFDSTKADIFTAMAWIAPFLPIIRAVFGLGAILIILLLVGSTIVDLAFIGLPIARESMQNKGEQKGGKIPLVSMDAVSVVKETESGVDSSGGYKNVYVLYFKRRILTYLILAICILYLVVGELGGLIAWLLTLGSGLV